MKSIEKLISEIEQLAQKVNVYTQLHEIIYQKCKEYNLPYELVQARIGTWQKEQYRKVAR